MTSPFQFGRTTLLLGTVDREMHSRRRCRRRMAGTFVLVTSLILVQQMIKLGTAAFVHGFKECGEIITMPGRPNRGQLGTAPNVMEPTDGRAQRCSRHAEAGSGSAQSIEWQSIVWPSPTFFGLMAASGAFLGPILDGFHSRFGALQYHNPSPFLVFGMYETAAWVPPMFGLAGLIIGGLYPVLDQALATPQDKKEPSAFTVVVGIACFIFQYYLSGQLLGQLGYLGGPAGGVHLVAEIFLWITGVAHWRIFDNTIVGLIVCVATAIGGPLIEASILNFPGWDVYAYAAPDIFGIPTWIIPVYFCGAPAVGNLARFILRAVR